MPEDVLFCSEYAKTGNGTRSILSARKKVGGKAMDVVTAASMSTYLLRREEIQREIVEQRTFIRNEALRLGITEEFVIGKIKYLLESDDFQAVNNGIKHAFVALGIGEKQKEPDMPEDDKIQKILLLSPEVQSRIHVMNEQIKSELLKPKPNETI